MRVQIIDADVSTFGQSVVVLTGVTDDGERVIRFGCDHRPAQVIVAALTLGEEPEADVEEWQILGTVAERSEVDDSE